MHIAADQFFHVRPVSLDQKEPFPDAASAVRPPLSPHFGLQKLATFLSPRYFQDEEPRITQTKVSFMKA